MWFSILALLQVFPLGMAGQDQKDTKDVLRELEKDLIEIISRTNLGDKMDAPQASGL
jgi:hypothetical protein